jgi:hypothetical protein
MRKPPSAARAGEGLQNRFWRVQSAGRSIDVRDAERVTTGLLVPPGPEIVWSVRPLELGGR